MKRRRMLSPLLSFALCGLVLSAIPRLAAAGQPHREVKQQILELEQQWRTATLNSDIPLMDKLLSDDYVGISWTGQVNNKSSQLDRLRNRTLLITRMELFDLKVKVVDSVAIVTSRAEVVGTNDGNQINDTFRYTRVYQRLPSGVWKITNFEATRVPPPGGPHGHAPHAPPPIIPASTPPPHHSSSSSF